MLRGTSSGGYPERAFKLDIDRDLWISKALYYLDMNAPTPRYAVVTVVTSSTAEVTGRDGKTIYHLRDHIFSIAQKMASRCLEPIRSNSHKDIDEHNSQRAPFMRVAFGYREEEKLLTRKYHVEIAKVLAGTLQVADSLDVEAYFLTAEQEFYRGMAMDDGMEPTKISQAAVLATLTRRFCTLFENDNPNFDRRRFMEAVYGKGENE